MTDLEKVEALFTELGIGFTTDIGMENGKPCKILTLASGTAKIVGYVEFFADFTFAEDGKFIEVGVWE